MAQQRIGIVVNGVTGRMGTQSKHLARPDLAIRQARRHRPPNGDTLDPDPNFGGAQCPKTARVSPNLPNRALDDPISMPVWPTRDDTIYFSTPKPPSRRAASVYAKPSPLGSIFIVKNL
jgi:hypothetical protein